MIDPCWQTSSNSTISGWSTITCELLINIDLPYTSAVVYFFGYTWAVFARCQCRPVLLYHFSCRLVFLFLAAPQCKRIERFYQLANWRRLAQARIASTWFAEMFLSLLEQLKTQRHKHVVQHRFRKHWVVQNMFYKFSQKHSWNIESLNMWIRGPRGPFSSQIHPPSGKPPATATTCSTWAASSHQQWLGAQQTESPLAPPSHHSGEPESIRWTEPRTSRAG